MKFSLLFAAAFAAISSLYSETLSFSGALSAALTKNPDVHIAAENLRLASLDEPALLAETDPVFGAEAAVLDDQAPRSAPAIQGAFSKQKRLDLYIRQSWLTGTEAEIFFDSLRTDSPAAFRPINPTVDAALGLSLRQPLLRYFWGRPDKANRRQARAGVEAARWRLKRAQENVAARTAIAYVNAWVADENIRIRARGVDDAKRLLTNYSEKQRYGLVTRSDFLQADASLRVQETELRTERSDFIQAQNALRADVFLGSTTVTVSDPTATGQWPAAIPEFEAAYAEALRRRPDYQAALQEKERAQWALRLERLNTLPELSAFGTYSSRGLSTERRAAWHDAGTFDDPVWEGGLALEVSIFRRRENVRREESLRRLKMAEWDAARLEETVRKDVSDAIERLANARERREAYKALVEVQRDRYKAEDENFRRGKSSTDLLIRFEDDVRQAERFYVRARADELIGWAQLAYATGTLLESIEHVYGVRP